MPRTLIIVFLLASISTACKSTPTSSPVEPTASAVALQPTRMVTPQPVLETDTPPPPSPTLVPLALIVNGDPVTLTVFQSALNRFRLGQGSGVAVTEEEAVARVMEDLIDQLLLAQAARQNGFSVDQTMVEGRISQLADQIGGQEALADWQAANGYSETEFRQELALEIAAAWMRDQIIGSVPDVAEQVHARQILLYNSDEAQRVYRQLQEGASFESFVAVYDPVSLGELGWFPRGYLLQPEIEAVAFALQPDEFSPVIETELGFHILQVVDRQPDRPLSPDARLALQAQALQAWLQTQRERSEISILYP